MTSLTLQLGSAALLAGFAGMATGAYAYLAPSSRLFIPVISRGSSTAGAVALTFDDGPRPEGTGPILDLLAHHGVKAAFFVIGENAARYPDLVQRMDDEGHLVCNHTYDHLRFGAMRSATFWRDQLRRTDGVIDGIIGKRPVLFRPPFGHKSSMMSKPLRDSGHLTVCWSRRGLDGIKTTPDRILKRLVPGARSGDILLLHDGREQWSQRNPAPTIAAITPLIAGIRAKGLEFQRLDKLIGREAYFATRTATGAASASSGIVASADAGS